MKESQSKSIPLLDRLLQVWRDGPDHPLKRRLHAEIVRRIKRNKVLVSTIFGLYHVDQRDFIGSQLINGGVYEPETLGLCRRLLKDGGVFFDVGANLGLYSVAVSMSKDVKVFSFEPDAKNFILLQRNLALNNRTQVRAFNCAVSNQQGLLSIHVQAENNRGTIRVSKSIENNDTIVAVTTLDAAIEYVGVTGIDVMKIDIEGHEIDAMRGLTLNSPRAPQHIIVEYWGSDDPTGGRPLRESEIYSYLLAHGYRCRTIHGDPADALVDLPECNVWFALEARSTGSCAQCESSPAAADR